MGEGKRMKITLTAEELQKLRAEIQDEDGESILDAYEPEPAFTMEFEYTLGGVDVLAAAYLAFDEGLDGWYLTDRIEDAARLAELIRAYLA
jgi:hypothetical protein